MKTLFEPCDDDGKIFLELKLDLFTGSISGTLHARPFQSPDVILRRKALAEVFPSTKKGVKQLFTILLNFFNQYGLLEEHFNLFSCIVTGDTSYSKSTHRVAITHNYLENCLKEIKKIVLDGLGEPKKLRFF